ncbi:MAG TPA: NPCBM/NEW2 domain-containing protein [Anaerohalosphaeraceae bacterium]|nr:NPCBM/NEW2 domain-containing protein [Phycisphaerae bacterium]HOM76941.1 NPCBM/NEW2 domain-containing protein [Anaerohalosphaeraceae bacterium]HPC65227.1 NPCBM/NEW2 domain-containing protein [Anaerohalosphaeraceae bacterium]HRS72310.1 NPCBM/NEW2 domain-containing protein [Anaerohalosphaeraceae bacterium]HRV21196.1 NPCBM/NEW2 domain-containing protein [Anaerohalosphaeraceae bacterium]
MDRDKLMSQYFFSSLNRQEQELFAKYLKEDPEFLKQFVTESYVQRRLYDLFVGQDNQKLLFDSAVLQSPYEMDLWAALLNEEKTAPTIELEVSKNEPVLIEKLQKQKIVRKSSKTTLITAVAALAAVILLIVYVQLNPKEFSDPVATLADMVDVRWADPAMSLKRGDRLFTRQGGIQLKEGILKIQMDNGSNVVVEAPSEFEFITYDQIELRYGRLYANVPRRAIGFIVSTPNSNVIDLGTQFGVKVNIDGGTEVHVLKGKVSLIAGKQSEEGTSELVQQGQARRVEKGQEAIQAIAINPGAFVRDIDSQNHYVWRGQPLDLADVIGGGNGWGTGQANTRIDPITGKLAQRMEPDGIQRTTPYILVPDLDFVDGLFIPDGRAGAVQVSSEGDMYEGCPETTGRCFYGPFNGSVLPLKTANEVFDHTVQIGGQTFGGPGRPIILLHSNLGITFDLRKIRHSLPEGTRISSFSALCGVGEGPASSKRAHDYVNFYILVDGQERFRADDMEYQSGLKPIDVNLSDSDRFLTLMTTDGSDRSVHLDWSFFVQPQLTIESVQ